MATSRLEVAVFCLGVCAAIVSAVLLSNRMVDDVCKSWSAKPMAVAVAKSTIRVPDDGSGLDLSSNQFENVTEWSKLVVMTRASYAVNISSSVVRAHVEDDDSNENHDYDSVDYNKGVQIHLTVDDLTPTLIEDVRNVYPCDSGTGLEIIASIIFCMAMACSFFVLCVATAVGSCFYHWFQRMRRRDFPYTEIV